MSVEFQITEMDRVGCVKYACRILRNMEDAEDAVQSAFMKAWRNRRNFRGDCATFAFLRTCTHYQCLEMIRNRATRLQHTVAEFPDDSAVMAFDARIEKRLLAKETISSLAKSIAPHRHYLAVFDLMFDGYKPSEIARMCEMNENTVKVIFFRIREIAAGVRS
jgi:RNA polymerase sigma factor (sigma-70 family)